jgi:hypothetical protein
MSQYRTIEIDFDIHKLIEAERRSFDDPPNAVLRRLLKLPDKANEQTVSAGRPWSSDGAVLPHGTSVRMTYSQKLIEGEIVDGKWVSEGRSFDTPSAAASAIATTKDGQNTTLNGWNYWKAKKPGSTEWVSINNLRFGNGVSPIKRRRLG